MNKKYLMNIGDKFNRLEVTNFTNDWDKVECICSCGVKVTVKRSQIWNNKTKSCGCLKSEVTIQRNLKHNLSHHRLYNIWSHMKIRCYNKNRKEYKYYGGKGVVVCDEWLDFQTFYNWAICNGYNDNLTIDRKDVNGNYEPLNCKWISFADQAKNSTQVKVVTAFNETKNLVDWSRDSRCKVCLVTLKRRIKKGINPEIAITNPERIRKNDIK